jgi:primosomal protein N' (replication factor Y)
MIDKKWLVLKKKYKKVTSQARYIRLQEQYNSNEGLSQLLDNLKNAQKQKEIILFSANCTG